ncbi:unnamed protein product [Arabidopsis thaliana]|uniref:Uncharacterized protein n=1 Tax=Arabidopsis thaliana TaxID=3702 RepID=A0A654ESK0_ARATH|nr:unnamed protein product [Arabidopsis thaliana]
MTLHTEDGGEIDTGRSWLVIEEVWFVELGLENARRVGEIRLRGELEEPEAEPGKDDVRSSKVERFVLPPVIADLMRSSMDWILAAMRKSLASMTD